MNAKAVVRKKRKNKTITLTNKLFTQAIYEEDYKKAGIVVLYCVYKEFAKEGILNALYNANSFYKRKDLRRGL